VPAAGAGDRIDAGSLTAPLLPPARGFGTKSRIGATLEWLDQPKRLRHLFVVPLTLLLLIIVGFPFLMNIKLSVSEFQANSPYTWWEAPFVGVDNYQQVLADDRFWAAVGRTLGLTASGIVIEALLGLGLAILMADVVRGRRIYTAIYLLPMMVIPVVSGFIFFMLFQEQGAINSGILSPLVGHTVTIPWLSEPRWAFAAILIADVWQWTPLMFLIFAAGLAAVPKNLSQASEVLGASKLQQLRYVALPLMKRIILVAAVIRGVELFKIFDSVFILTGGGPGSSTETISLYLYSTGGVAFNVAYSAAASFLVLLLIGLIAWFALKPLEIVERDPVAP
jgi:multiple sugar transport system permease protein